MPALQKEENIVDRFRLSMKPFARALIFSLLSFSLWAPAARAEWVGTEAVVRVQAANAERARVADLFSRAQVQDYLRAQGVDPALLEARVAGLTDEEVQAVAAKLDALPAGASFGGDLIFAGLVVFITLLVTDILGYTDVYPFVKKRARR